HQSGGEIGKDVAVKIFHQQHVELPGADDQLQAGVIDDDVAESDRLVARREFARAVEKQAVAQLHDVGFVHRGDFFPAVAAREVEGEPGDLRARLLGHDLEALHHAGNHFVLDAGVKALGVLAHDDQIDALITRLHPGKIFDRPQVGVKIESLAQGHVHAGKAL